MQIHLNGNDITNREQLHDALSEALELPEWYGRSLDALYDCLVSGQLRGAACDTFADGEPVSPDHNLLTLRNFSATPHLGGNTEEALQKPVCRL